MEKILLITSNFSPLLGGVARYYQVLAREIPEFTVVTSVPGGAEEGIWREAWEWKLWPRWLPLLWKISAWQRQTGAKLTAAGQVLPVGTALWIRRRCLGQPYVVFLHGLDVARGTRNAWKRFLVRRILRGARLVITNSDYTRSLAEHAGSMPVRTVVVYPSLSLSLTPPIGSVDALRKAFNLQGKLVLLTVARLVKRKGIERVLKLLPKLAQEFPNLTYVVLGSGPEQDRLKGIAAGHSLPVLFPGAVKDDFLAAWYLLCDVFILTPEPDPQDVEGFGIVYLEAQAAGKPIVATAVAGVPEAVDGAGVLVQSDAELLQACRRLLSDQLERARLGAHGREHVAQFSPAAQAAKLKNYLYGY